MLFIRRFITVPVAGQHVKQSNEDFNYLAILLITSYNFQRSRTVIQKAVNILIAAS